jgi:hypothetical protein
VILRELVWHAKSLRQSKAVANQPRMLAAAMYLNVRNSMTEPDQPNGKPPGDDPSTTRRLKIFLPSNDEGISLAEIVGDRQPEDVKKFRSEMASLRRRLRASAKKTKQLSSDTAFLIKKTTELPCPKTISCNDIGWQETLREIDVGPEGVSIVDAHNVEAIKFVSAFAAKNQLLVDYSNASFRLIPRDQ